MSNVTRSHEPSIARATRRLARPPEVAILNSKQYGRKRIQSVQRKIREAGLDALLISNRCLNYISYVSNFYPSWGLNSGVAFVPAEGEPTLYLQVFSDAHLRVAKETIWFDDVVDVPRDPISESDNKNFYEEVLRKIAQLKLTRGRIGLAGGELDWLLPHFFANRAPDLRTEDANQVLWSLLIVKDEVELALIRHSQKIIDEVSYPQYFQSAVVGAVDADVQAELLCAMLSAGADPIQTYQSFRADTYGSGTWSLPVEQRRIQKGDIILTEPVPWVGRYNSEKMFTFSVGKNVPDSQMRGAEAAYEGVLLALEEMKPGKPLRPIFDKCERHLQKRGYAGSSVLVGHWIGIANHEGPRFTAEGTEDIILQPGMVMAWHPNLVVPGEVRTCSSATPLITENGVEDLCKLPMQPMYYL